MKYCLRVLVLMCACLGCGYAHAADCSIVFGSIDNENGCPGGSTAVMGSWNDPTSHFSGCNVARKWYLIPSTGTCTPHSDCNSCLTSGTYKTKVSGIYVVTTDGECTAITGTQACCTGAYTNAGSGYYYTQCGGTATTDRVYTCGGGYYSTTGKAYVKTSSLSSAQTYLNCTSCKTAGGGYGYCTGYAQTSYGCAAGYYKKGTSCSQCASSMTSTAGSNPTCYCKAGYYRNSSTQQNCIECPYNTTSSAGSNVGVASCDKCKSGYFGTVSGTTGEEVSASCKACPVFGHVVVTNSGVQINTYCAQGTSADNKADISACGVPATGGTEASYSYSAVMDNAGVYTSASCYVQTPYTSNADKICINAGKYCVQVGRPFSDPSACKTCMVNAAASVLGKTISETDDAVVNICARVTVPSGGGTIMCAPDLAKAESIATIMKNCTTDWGYVSVVTYE